MTANAIAAYLDRLDRAARSASIEEESYRQKRWSGSSGSNGSGPSRSGASATKSGGWRCRSFWQARGSHGKPDACNL